MTVFNAQDLTKDELTQLIKDKALELGYFDVGIANAEPFDGYCEEMDSRPGYDPWKHNETGPYSGEDPIKVMPEARSIISVIFDFSDVDYPSKLTSSIGRAYLGRGYLARPDSLNGVRKTMFVEFLKNLGIGVDESGPMRIPERLAAARAGLITFGSNNLAYSKKAGSFIILTAFIVDVELTYDKPTIKRPCPPDCNKCVEACPTGALYAPGKLDMSKCLLCMQIRPSFIDEEQREQMGISVHGCDRCQEACPRNAPVLANANRKDRFLERLAKEFDLEKLLLLDDAYYERVVRPIMYNYITEPWMFQRNAAIALGNTHDIRHLPALRRAKDVCPEEVQEYLNWAIEKIESEAGRS